MAKQITYPHEIKFGGSIVRILKDPLRIPLTPEIVEANKLKLEKQSAEKSDKPSPKKLELETHKEYESFLIEYYVAGKRKRVRRNTHEKAVAKAQEIGVKLLNNDTESLQITGADRRAYLSAKENLKGTEKSLDHATKEFADAFKILHPLGVSLLTAVSQYADALGRLKGEPLPTAIEFFERHGADIKAKKTVPEVVKELIKSLGADHAGGYHVRDMQRRLGRFSEAFPDLILDVTESAINEWLRGLRTLPGRRNQEDFKSAPLSPKTRNNFRGAVVQLFNFARQEKYLPRDRSTAAEGTKSVGSIRHENEIFTPKDIEQLLSGAPDYMIPGMAMKAFSGVRTEEIAEVDWSHILFDQDCIKISSAISKLGQRRLIHLHPNLKAWLLPFRKPAGRLCDHWTTPQSVFQAWDRYAKRKFEFDIGANRFRNSFISYRVAETNDIKLVSLESGNSPKTIQQEYLEITTPQEAAKWFGIFPKNHAK